MADPWLCENSNQDSIDSCSSASIYRLDTIFRKYSPLDPDNTTVSRFPDSVYQLLYKKHHYPYVLVQFSQAAR